MNPDSENFEPLRRLLALKRYEQPPPRYFSDFSSQVLAGIRAQEAARHRSATDGTWWQRLWTALEAKPLFAGAFGAGVCAVLVSGILTSGEVISAAPPVSRLAPVALQPEGLTRGENLGNLPLMDSNSVALKALFDSFELQGHPVSVSFPQN